MNLYHIPAEEVPLTPHALEGYTVAPTVELVIVSPIFISVAVLHASENSLRVGMNDGAALTLGVAVGDLLGALLSEGAMLGSDEGSRLGIKLGIEDGNTLGKLLGFIDGVSDG